MTSHSFCRRALFGLLNGLTLVGAGIATSIALGALTPAETRVSADFRAALDPYGHWVNHSRWGEVWVPDDRPPAWRPYKFGHWIYTDE